MSRKLLLLLIFLSFFSGCFGYVSYLMNNPVVRLWKESLIILLFIVSLISSLNKLNKKLLVAMWTISMLYVVYYLNSIELPVMMIFYQLKLDFLIILFVFCAILTFSKMNDEKLNEMIKLIAIYFVLFSTLNAITIIFQHFFTDLYFNLIGFSWGNWGEDFGLKIQTSNGVLRAPGLLTGFVQSGTLMLLATIVLWETYKRKIIRIKPFIFFILISTFTLCTYFTLYKNAMIGLLLFYSMKIIEGLINRKHLVYGFYLVIFPFVNFFFFISSHTYFTYNIVNTINPFYAHYSIYLRILQHLEIIRSLNTFPKLLFGAGLGLNGTGNFAFDKSQFGMESLSLDSTYIYILSNYGFITVISFLIFLVLLLNRFFKYSEFDLLGARYIIVYIFCVEFYFNNLIINFPINIMIALITIASLILIRRNRMKVATIETMPITLNSNKMAISK